MINTLLVILEQSLLHLPLVLGSYISLSLLKVPDLSIESAYVVGAIFGSQVVLGTSSMYPWSVLLCVLTASLLGGALVGFVSSMLTQKGSFPHLLSSIVTFGLFHGINQYISPFYVSLTAAHNPLIIQGSLNQYPELYMVACIGLILTILIYGLLKTQLGYSYAVYGNNPHFFKNYGISTAYVFITGVMLANALAGMSGYLCAQSVNVVELTMGVGKALLCITVLILGKVLVRTSRPLSIGIPLVGTVAYFGLQQGLLKVGFDLKYFTAVQAFIIMCILLYTYYKNPSRMSNDNLGV